MGDHRHLRCTADVRRLPHMAGGSRGEGGPPTDDRRWVCRLPAGPPEACNPTACRSAVHLVGADDPPRADSLPAAEHRARDGHRARRGHRAADHPAADDQTTDLTGCTASCKDGLRAGRWCAGVRRCGTDRCSAVCCRCSAAYLRRRSVAYRRCSAVCFHCQSAYPRRLVDLRSIGFRRSKAVRRRRAFRRDTAGRFGWACRLLIGLSRLRIDRRDCRRRLDQSSVCLPPRCQR